MRSVKYRTHGGPEVLELVEGPAPLPNAGELLIEVHAVSVNPVDWKIRSGRAGQLPAGFPASTGRDGAGIVRATGSGADPDLVGARVCFLAPRGSGTWAEVVALPAECAVAIPDALPWTEAAALPLAGISAWRGLVTAADLQPGMRVLIHGGSGGVGSIAVQLARDLGAHVAATCSARNAGYVRALGAHQVIPYDEVAFEEAVTDIDVVFDLIGGEVHRRSYPVLRPGGTMVYLNAAPIEDRGSEFGVRVVMAQVMPDPAALSALVGKAANGTFRPIVTQVLPFEEFRRAQAAAETGHGPGKLVLTLA
jgi:NADPH:quinone reductase-like Zn-dependent oxidoreductase